MSAKIALLRGINVGGKRKIFMNDLRGLFSRLGYTNVHSYIQSGNIVFNAESQESNKEISNKLEAEIYKKYGFDVPVIVRSEIELEKLISSNPYLKQRESIPENLLVTFLQETPAFDHIELIKTFDFSPDSFRLGNKEVYLFCAGKYHESKLSNNFFESKLKCPATTRNWKTTLKLLELVKSLHI